MEGQDERKSGVAEMKINMFVVLIIIVSIGMFIKDIPICDGIISLMLILVASEINKLRKK